MVTTCTPNYKSHVSHAYNNCIALTRRDIYLALTITNVEESFVLETDLHAIYLVTPLSVCYTIHEIDWSYFLDLFERLPKSKIRVGELVGVKLSFLGRAVAGRIDPKAVSSHKRLSIFILFPCGITG